MDRSALLLKLKNKDIMATITRELFDKIIDALKEKGITNENAWYEDSTTVFSYDTDMKTRNIAIEMSIPNALSFEQISVQDVREVATKWLAGVPFEPLIIEVTVSLKRKGDAYAATFVKGGVRNGNNVFQIVDEPMAFVYADTDKVLVLGKVSIEQKPSNFIGGDSYPSMCYSYKGAKAFIKEGWVRLKVNLQGDEVYIPLCVEDFDAKSVIRDSTTIFGHELNGRKYRITINF